jgi:hypothetical protein
MIWTAVKTNGGARTLVHSPADLMRAVVGRLRHRQKCPEVFPSSFHIRRRAMLHAHTLQHMC